ncbi:hypothetical protein MMC08_006910 [Hypocenomyce scalaris]|nr:hypothetical protein [Hypocenomyce scalaris]
MSTQFTTLLPPPGPLIATYDRLAPSSTQPPSIPPTFLEAMSIRETVFVQSQGVPLENELDADDPRSWHWVVYASVGVPKGGGEERKGSESGRLPVGTLRLVPPPHPPHPEEGSKHLIDNAEDAAPAGAGASEGAMKGENRSTSMHDGKEAYVKLGRLATLEEYRGLGLGHLLVNTALEWVGRHWEEVSEGSSDPVEREREMEAGEGGEGRWRGLVLVHAQVAVEGFWRGMGFVKDEGMGEWWEEGIRHVGMWRRVEVKEER